MLLCLGVLFASTIAASGPAVTWRAPAGCPSQRDVEERVAQQLTDVDPGTADGVAAHAKVVMTEAGTWRVSIAVDSADVAPPRELEVGSCDAAAEAVALSIAIALGSSTDADEASVPAPLESVPDPDPPNTPPLQTPLAFEDSDLELRESAAPGPSRRERTLRGFMGIDGGLGFAVLPVGGQLSLRGGVLGRRWLFAAGASHWIRRAIRLPDDAAVGGNVSATTGFVAAGPRWVFGKLEVPLLAGAEVGAMRARGVGATDARTRNVVWAAALLAGGLGFAPISRLALVLRGELVVPLVAHQFVLLDLVEVVHTGPVGGRLVAGFELRLP